MPQGVQIPRKDPAYLTGELAFIARMRAAIEKAVAIPLELLDVAVHSDRFGDLFLPWYLYGQKLLEQGRYDVAAHAFRTALSCDPTDYAAGRARFGLGLVLLRQGRSEEADLEFALAVADDPSLRDEIDALEERVASDVAAN